MTSKPDLIIVAHGSRREQSNQEVRDLADKIEQISGHIYRSVSAGFLELAEPSIPDALLQKINDGAQSIDVFPYFLSAGRHVTVDVPNEIEKVSAIHHNVSITLKPYLGDNQDLPHIILAQLS